MRWHSFRILLLAIFLKRYTLSHAFAFVLNAINFMLDLGGPVFDHLPFDAGGLEVRFVALVLRNQAVSSVLLVLEAGPTRGRMDFNAL